MQLASTRNCKTPVEVWRPTRPFSDETIFDRTAADGALEFHGLKKFRAQFTLDNGLELV